MLSTSNDTTSKLIIYFLNMKDDLFLFETGLNSTQYHQVLSVINTCEISENKKELALGVYLSRLHKGYTFEEMSVKWPIDRSTPSKYCKILKTNFEQTLILKYLKLPQNREEAFQQLTETSKIFYCSNGSNIIVIFDWTYLFIQKDADFSFQGNVYCVHKSRNLINPMMAVYPDGYIAGIFDRYPGKNDASIMDELLQTNCWSSFETGDVLIVDSGFRDSLPVIDEQGFQAKISSFADGRDFL